MSLCRLRRVATVVPTILSLAAGAGAVSATAAAAAPAGFTLHVGVINNQAGKVSGIEGWGEEKNLWIPALKSVGVTKISWQTFPNGPNLDAALTGGSLDIGILGDTPAVTAKAAGGPTRLFAQEETGLDTWIFAKKHGPKTLAGLAGGTVAVPEGSYIYRALIGMLAQNGLSSKVHVTNLVSVPEGIAALDKGSIDAYAEEPDGPLLSGGFPVIAKASEGYPDLLGSTLDVISTSAVSAHPGLAAAWNKARASILANAKADASAYYAWDAGPTGDSVRLFKEITPLSLYQSQPFTTAGSKLLADLDQFLVQQKIITAPVDLSTWELKS